MNLDRYPFFSNDDFKEYSFYSEGPKGRIKKVIKFMKIQDSITVFNLAFGDEDPLSGVVSDSVTTNNKDRDMVLATVANAVNAFCDHHGNHYIYAEGRNPARTRLYQISISRFWNEISNEFDVYSIIDGVSYSFQQNVNDEAFLVKRKIK
jgi:hypothetical protein